MATHTQQRTLHIGHSPDPDDAFMWYPLGGPAPQDLEALENSASADEGIPATEPLIDTGHYRFIHVMEDIEALNRQAERGDLEITAISVHQYPYVADRYALTSCGSSMGDGYGPMVVAPAGSKLGSMDALLDQAKSGQRNKIRIAIPGERTTAFLALSLLLGGRNPVGIEYEQVRFDRIIPAVVEGRFDAGLIIHEGQLTFAKAGLDCVVDLGKWWGQTRGLPLPLGANAIRRDLGDELPEICAILDRSIRYALDHRHDALNYALGFARGMDTDLADQFVGMYVNQWTLDYGAKGREAVDRLLREGSELGIVPDPGKIDFIGPS